MSVVYIEEFKVLGRTYGIEDHEDGRPDDEHFFPQHYREGREQRFKLWAGGCGIGQAKKIEDARYALHAFVVTRLLEEAKEARARAKVCSEALELLGTDSFNLGRFRV